MDFESTDKARLSPEVNNPLLTGSDSYAERHRDDMDV